MKASLPLQQTLTGNEGEGRIQEQAGDSNGEWCRTESASLRRVSGGSGEGERLAWEKTMVRKDHPFHLVASGGEG